LPSPPDDPIMKQQHFALSRDKEEFIMTGRLIVTIAFVAFASAGCSQSAKLAQRSFDRSMEVQRGVRKSLFIKAWGMNRIAGAEANGKAAANAKVELLRSQLNGQFSPEVSERIIDELADRVARNEPLTTKGFAWLAFLMQQGERADAMMGNVDFYIQSQHGIIEQLSDQIPGTVDDMERSFGRWKDLLGGSWESVKGMFGDDKPSPEDK